MIQLTMSGLYHVMLGLEDPFRQRGGSFSLDRIQVPEMVDVTRRVLLKIEEEARLEWNVPASQVSEAEQWGYSIEQLGTLTGSQRLIGLWPRTRMSPRSAKGRQAPAVDGGGLQ